MRKARDLEALREVIAKSPLSHRALARAAVCSRNTPGRLLAGRPVNDDTAIRLAKALGRSFGELFVPVESTDEQQASKQEAAA